MRTISHWLLWDVIEYYGNIFSKGDKNFLIGSGEHVYLMHNTSSTWYAADIIQLSYSGGIISSKDMVLIADPSYVSEGNPGEEFRTGAIYCYFMKSKPQIRFPALSDKYYGDFPFNHCISDASKIISSDQNIAKIEGSRIRIMGVGSCEIMASRKEDTLYYSDSVSQTLTVHKGNLYITVDNKKREYYDGNPEYSLSFFGFRNYDDINDLQVPPSIYCSADSFSDAGLYPIEISGGVDENYSFILKNGTLEITKAPLQVVADDVSRTYGSENPEFTYTISGFKNQEDISVVDQLPTIRCSATTSSRVGTYLLTPVLALDNNYSFNYVRGELTVNKAPLSVRVKDATRSFGQENPEFQVEYDGFVDNENESAIDLLPKTYCSADSQSAPGNYPVTVSGAIDFNYDFIYTDGILTISPKVGNTDYNENELHVWPNPTSGLLYIQDPENKEVTIYSGSGIIVKTIRIQSDYIDLSSFPTGIYLILSGKQSCKIFKR